MTVKRGGLGRNLSALLGQSSERLVTAAKTDETRVSNLALDALQPGKYQPRADIETQPLEELANSIKQQGILQPIIVRALEEGRYEIIAGERRWRAAELAGLSEVPTLIRQVDDETAMALALIENLQREDLNAMDQARAMDRLCQEFDLTHQQIAELLGKSRAAVSNYLRLLSLCPEVKRLLEHGDIDMGHARALLSLNPAQQQQAAKIIVMRQLSVRETEKLAARLKQGGKIAKKAVELPEVYQQQVAHLSSQLKTNVKLKPGAAGKGNLIIQYKSLPDLEAILATFQIEP